MSKARDGQLDTLKEFENIQMLVLVQDKQGNGLKRLFHEQKQQEQDEEDEEYCVAGGSHACKCT